MKFITTSDPRKYVTEERAAGKLVVWIPRSIRSKEKLLGALAQGLHFPNYFGGNWDAFEECLNDLSWLPEKQSVCIVHECLPFGDGENREIYFDILRGAITANKSRCWEILAVFPE